jgi:hypothetical protein
LLRILKRTEPIRGQAYGSKDQVRGERILRDDVAIESPFTSDPPRREVVDADVVAVERDANARGARGDDVPERVQRDRARDRERQLGERAEAVDSFGGEYGELVDLILR